MLVVQGTESQGHRHIPERLYSGTNVMVLVCSLLGNKEDVWFTICMPGYGVHMVVTIQSTGLID